MKLKKYVLAGSVSSVLLLAGCDLFGSLDEEAEELEETTEEDEEYEDNDDYDLNPENESDED